MADDLGIGGAELRIAGELVAIELLGDWQPPLGFGEAAEVEGLCLTRRTRLTVQRADNLADGLGLFFGAEDRKARAAGIAVNRGRLRRLAGGLLAVNLRYFGQQFGGA